MNFLRFEVCITSTLLLISIVDEPSPIRSLVADCPIF
nr:MAG TPA: hypothetical protein [Caudoviricetes sp.]